MMAKFCTHCGSELVGSKNFCASCGASVTDNVETAKEQSTAKEQTTTQAKSKIAAGLLGIFLGGFGVHNFYLGYTGKAVAQLLITVLSCGILSVVSSVWGLIEGIMILTGSITTDANGNALQE